MSPEFEGLALSQLIDLLNEVPDPDPVSMSPQTSGWLVLASLLLAGIGLVAHWARTRRQREAYRHAALRALDAAAGDPARIAAVLRRTALAGFPRGDVAALTGDDWLTFLDAHHNGTGFSNGPGRIFTRAPYSPTPPDPAAEALARDWIIHHRREAPG